MVRAMPEPDFYAEDLPLIERLSKAWKIVFDRARASDLFNLQGSAHAANISLMAALHKRCEIAEARVVQLEQTCKWLVSEVKYLKGQVRL
jgi:L-arabinose isomerase